MYLYITIIRIITRPHIFRRPNLACAQTSLSHVGTVIRTHQRPCCSAFRTVLTSGCSRVKSKGCTSVAGVSGFGKAVKQSNHHTLSVTILCRVANGGTCTSSTIGHLGHCGGVAGTYDQKATPLSGNGVFLLVRTTRLLHSCGN